MHTKTPLVAFISLLLAMLIWGSSFIALKAALIDTQPYTIIFLRMLIASMLFILFLKRFFRYKLERKDIQYLLLLSLFEPALYFRGKCFAFHLCFASWYCNFYHASHNSNISRAHSKRVDYKKGSCRIFTLYGRGCNFKSECREFTKCLKSTFGESLRAWCNGVCRRVHNSCKTLKQYIFGTLYYCIASISWSSFLFAFFPL